MHRMRRLAPLGLFVLLTGCGTMAGSPFDGFGGFFGDSHTVERDAHRVPGDSPNLRRVVGADTSVAPVEPEPGNIWPGPQPPEPTLSDLERMQNSNMPLGQEPEVQQPQRQPRPFVPGSSAPPGPPRPAPQVQPGRQPLQPAPDPNLPASRTYQTPQGPATGSGPGGVQTYTDPKGGTGIVVPNGNGTSTLIAPDGSITTVPNPR
jgi:hypothetical protein